METAKNWRRAAANLSLLWLSLCCLLCTIEKIIIWNFKNKVHTNTYLIKSIVMEDLKIFRDQQRDKYYFIWICLNLLLLFLWERLPPFYGHSKSKCTSAVVTRYAVDVLWGQPIKLIQVVSTSEFHKYGWNDLDLIFFAPATCCRASEVRT